MTSRRNGILFLVVPLIVAIGPLATAQEIGVTIPPEVLERADRVIQ